jgi:hypothetical protein
MITKVIELLQTEDFLGVSNNIEIAKGKYEIKTLKMRFNRFKRDLHLVRLIYQMNKNKQTK